MRQKADPIARNPYLEYAPQSRKATQTATASFVAAVMLQQFVFVNRLVLTMDSYGHILTFFVCCQILSETSSNLGISTWRSRRGFYIEYSVLISTCLFLVFEVILSTNLTPSTLKNCFQNAFLPRFSEILPCFSQIDFGESSCKIILIRNDTAEYLNLTSVHCIINIQLLYYFMEIQLVQNFTLPG